jgi:hypothetical protein
VFGFAAAFGCRRPAKSRSVQFNFVCKNGWPLLPLQHSKKPHGRGKQSLSRAMLEKRGQKGKFFRRQKFALLHNKDTKIHRIFKEKNV